MKFIHTADLHIGKRVCERSMLSEQQHILQAILTAVKAEKPDALFIAGDIYDKAVPPAEAVSLLDDFLVALAATGTKVFVLCGNHDSAERLAFGGRLMENENIYMSPLYSGTFTPVTLQDEFGAVDIWLLPFVRPAVVRAGLQSAEERSKVTDYTSAVRLSLSKMNFKAGRRNVLLAHQFVTGAERSESEENVGGLDNVEAAVFAGFDYVALGHIHKAQNVAYDAAGQVRVRYSGTPLKYSLSEAGQRKSLTVVELGEAQEGKLAPIIMREIPLLPNHELREIKGSFAEIISPEFRQKQLAMGLKADDYIYVKLTDENDITDAALKLRGIYSNLMMLDYDNERTRSQKITMDIAKVEQKSPLELFSAFFLEMTKRELNAEESEFLRGIIEKIWGAE